MLMLPASRFQRRYFHDGRCSGSRRHRDDAESSTIVTTMHCQAARADTRHVGLLIVAEMTCGERAAITREEVSNFSATIIID